MRLEEAIEVLLPMVIRNFNQPSQEECDAIKLGIEALKRVNLEEPFASFYIGEPLPGETKE